MEDRVIKRGEEIEYIETAVKKAKSYIKTELLKLDAVRNNPELESSLVKLLPILHSLFFPLGRIELEVESLEYQKQEVIKTLRKAEKKIYELSRLVKQESQGTKH
ncbi:hypothetical protein LO80_06965 [Candidatus Francisella endociliophora]|uniref:Uncharacterized protein n=1 Tax=Candidatus Francisella endociliophora TaxID=653937 RepID=A0A097EQ82_9GAMM|nr:hypothetical protein [Francisella sp. FSC1006]AIT09728.1 hypothetical protein LO80_06965 [Francisella sp. FSC1006]